MHAHASTWGRYVPTEGHRHDPWCQDLGLYGANYILRKIWQYLKTCPILLRLSHTIVIQLILNMRKRGIHPTLWLCSVCPTLTLNPCWRTWSPEIWGFSFHSVLFNGYCQNKTSGRGCQTGNTWWVNHVNSTLSSGSAPSLSWNSEAPEREARWNVFAGPKEERDSLSYLDPSQHCKDLNRINPELY